MNNIFLCGIKGTGMSNLAIILKKNGNNIFGCDSEEFFPTEENLKKNKIEYFNGFQNSLINKNIEIFIYSTAFSNIDMVLFAKDNKSISTYSYPEYLAKITKDSNCFAVSGTHGKTTTSALTTYTLSRGKRKEFPFFSIFGSSIIGEESVTFQGNENCLIEACEYQDHFLLYNLKGILITSIEFDHPDFYKDLNQMIKSYKQLILNIKPGGFIILNIDDKETKDLIHFIHKERQDLVLLTYGFSKSATVTIERGMDKDTVSLPIIGMRMFKIPVFQTELIGNYVGSSILATCILLDRPNPNLYIEENSLVFEEAFITLLASSLKNMENFPGVKRRLEIQEDNGRNIFIEDYAHHPSEIRTSIKEIKLRYPNKKLLVIFTPHTSSRTKSLLNEFVNSLILADKVILTSTYASARNDIDGIDWTNKLYKKLDKFIFKSLYSKIETAIYVKNEEEIAPIAASMLEIGDICITLGAANKSYLYKDIKKCL